MAKEIYIDNGGNEIPICGVPLSAEDLPIQAGSSTSTEEALSELIYSHGTYTYTSETIVGKATASNGGIPRVFFILPKMVMSTDTLTVDSVTISACRKYDGSSVPQTTATATYDATDNKIQIDGDTAVGAHNLITLQFAITFTIS